MTIPFDDIRTNGGIYGILNSCAVSLGFSDKFDSFFITDVAGFIVTEAEWCRLKQELDSFYATWGHVVELNNEMLNDELFPEVDDNFGYIYLATKEERPGYKIGLSVDPARRMSELQTNLLYRFPADHAYEAEAKLHKYFYSQNIKHEWFNLSPNDIRRIKKIREYKNGKFHFTYHYDTTGSD